MDIDIFLLVLSIIGTVAFAISGALTAIENKLDIFGVLILAIVTACGGGLLRDTMIGKGYAMFTDWWYPLISVCVGATVFIIMWFLRNLAWENSLIYKVTFVIVDALGLGVFVATGAMRAEAYGVTTAFQVIFYSVITAVGGGLIRDIFVCKIPVIFRKHIYAAAAIIGGLIFYYFIFFGVNAFFTTFITVTVVVVIRILAFRFKWNFPRIHLKEETN